MAKKRILRTIVPVSKAGDNCSRAPFPSARPLTRGTFAATRSGHYMTSIPEGRIGDYVIENVLEAPPGGLAYAATHVLLPRRARILVAQSHHQTVAMQVMRYACLV